MFEGANRRGFDFLFDMKWNLLLKKIDLEQGKFKLQI